MNDSCLTAAADSTDSADSARCPQCHTLADGAPVPSEQFPYVSAIARCLSCGAVWSIVQLLGDQLPF